MSDLGLKIKMKERGGMFIKPKKRFRSSLCEGDLFKTNKTFKLILRIRR